MNENKNSYESFLKSKYFSTKHTNYFSIYDSLFLSYVGLPITFVEVGILGGGSLHMWRDFFGPQARIIGIDNNPEAIKWKNDFEIFIGDQSNPAFWVDFFTKIGPVDILLDDGGHTNAQQIQTVISSINNIKSKGLIVVEDTHCSFLESFGNPSRRSFIKFASMNAEKLTFRNTSINKPAIFVKNVESITFYDSIVSISINNELPEKSTKISNGGTSSEEVDMRKGNQNTLKFTNNFLGKLAKRFFLLKKIANILLLLKIKIENYLAEYKFRKFF